MCHQHVQQHRSGGGQCVLQLGFPSVAGPLPAVTRAPGQRGHGGEHAVPVLLEGSVHGALGLKVWVVDSIYKTDVARNI